MAKRSRTESNTLRLSATPESALVSRREPTTLLDAVFSHAGPQGKTLPDLPLAEIHGYAKSCPYSIILHHDTLQFENERLVSIMSDAPPAHAARHDAEDTQCVSAVYLPDGTLARVLVSADRDLEPGYGNPIIGYKMIISVTDPSDGNRVVDRVTFATRRYFAREVEYDSLNIREGSVSALLPDPNGFTLAVCFPYHTFYPSHVDPSILNPSIEHILLVDLSPSKRGTSRRTAKRESRIREVVINDPASVQYSSQSNLVPSRRDAPGLCQVVMSLLNVKSSASSRHIRFKAYYCVLRKSGAPCLGVYGFCEDTRAANVVLFYTLSVRINHFDAVPVVACEYAMAFVRNEGVVETLAPPQQQREFIAFMRARLPGIAPDDDKHPSDELPVTHVDMSYDVREHTLITRRVSQVPLDSVRVRDFGNTALLNVQYMESLAILVVQSSQGMFVCPLDASAAAVSATGEDATEHVAPTFVTCSLSNTEGNVYFRVFTAQLPGNVTTRLYELHSETVFGQFFVVMYHIMPGMRISAKVTGQPGTHDIRSAMGLIQSMDYVSCLSSLLLTSYTGSVTTHICTTKVRVNSGSGTFGDIVDYYSAPQEAIEPAQYVLTAVDPRAHGTSGVPYMKSLIDVIVNVPERHSFQGFKTDADIRDVDVWLDDESVRPLGHMLLRPSTGETVVFKARIGETSGGQQVHFTVPDGTLPVYVVLRSKDTGTFVNHVLFPTQTERDLALVSASAASGDSHPKRARSRSAATAAHKK